VSVIDFGLNQWGIVGVVVLLYGGWREKEEYLRKSIEIQHYCYQYRPALEYRVGVVNGNKIVQEDVLDERNSEHFESTSIAVAGCS
jgi:hypothetical protein